MSNADSNSSTDPEKQFREPLTRSTFAVPTARLLQKPPVTTSSEPRDGRRAARSVRGGHAEYPVIKGELHNLMLDEFNERNLLTASEEVLSAAVREFVDRMLETQDLPLE